jgi:transposase
MEQIPAAELERVMRVQDVMLQATARKITWWQAAEILGISVRTMRRWKWRYENKGMKMLFDRRKGKPNWRKIDSGHLSIKLCFDAGL